MFNGFIKSKGEILSWIHVFRRSLVCRGACCADPTAVNRLCMGSRREVETSRRPTGSLGCCHVLVDVVTERTRAGISQSVLNTGLVGMWEIQRRNDGIWWVSWRVTLRILRLLCASQDYELEWNKCWRTQILFCLRRKRKQSSKRRQREERNYILYIYRMSICLSIYLYKVSKFCVTQWMHGVYRTVPH